MEWWMQSLLLAATIPIFCRVVDHFISKGRNLTMKNSLTELWFSLAIFSYPKAIQKSVANCNSLFDQIYGHTHFAWRCFLPSSVISILSVLLFYQLFSIFSNFRLFQSVFDFRGVVFFAVFINVWADYFSLVETRWLLRWAEKVQFKHLPFLIILDLACTSAIYVVTFWLFVYLPVAVAGLQITHIGALKFFWSNLTGPLSNPGAAAIVWSTFITSILFYFFCLSALSLKFLGLTQTPLMNFLQNLQEEDRLLTAVGLFLAALILFITTIFKFIEFVLGV